jgi:hypothetical protein
MRWARQLNPAVVLLLLMVSPASGCNLVPVIRPAEIQTRQPLHVTHWGEAKHGLSAGIAVKGPEIDEKVLDSKMPSVRLLCKLRNVSDRPIRIVRPFHGGFGRASLSSVASKQAKRWPDSWWMPNAEIVIELPPGEEMSHEYSFRVSSRPEQIAVRFTYDNYAAEAVLDEDEQPRVVSDIWTGHLESGILEATIR